MVDIRQNSSHIRHIRHKMNISDISDQNGLISDISDEFSLLGVGDIWNDYVHPVTCRVHKEEYSREVEHFLRSIKFIQ